MWKHWVTFAKGIAPSPEESPKCEAGADVAYQLPLPTWQPEEAPHKGQLVETKEGGWDHPSQRGCES